MLKSADGVKIAVAIGGGGGVCAVARHHLFRAVALKVGLGRAAQCGVLCATACDGLRNLIGSRRMAKFGSECSECPTLCE